jgi:16S rRNA (uracil1498-N3)-methyltransferase
MTKLHRFHIYETEITDNRLYIHDKEVLKYARKVLRHRVGDKIELFDGGGGKYIGNIEKLTNKLLVVLVTEQVVSKPRHGRRIILAQALPKAGKIDSILKFNTEIGVSEFVMFESDYSVVKVKHYSENKMLRLNKILKESARQSINDFVPSISDPVRFSKMLETEADIKLIFHTSVGNNKRTLSAIKTALKKDQSVLVCIGPEGGFSVDEIKMAKSNGFEIVALNLPVMRTETAGLVVASYLLID